MSRWWGIVLTWGYFALAAVDVGFAVSAYIHHDDAWIWWAAFATFFLYNSVVRLIRQEIKKGPLTIKLNGQSIVDIVRKYDPNA